jgi:hypothetical protein
MARRSKKSKSAHDRKVRSEANKLRKAGWNVKADLPGFERPKPIGKYGFIPDIEATKRGGRRIIEVETLDSLKADREQHSAFRRSAAQRKNTSFRVKVAGKGRG